MDTAVAPAPSAPVGRSRRRRGWIVGAVVLVLVLVGVGTVGWWLRHPDPAFVGGYGFGQDGVVVGDTVWTALTEPSSRSSDDRVITIDAVEPRVTRDGTDARIEYFVCTFDEAYGASRGVSGFGYGGDTQEAERQCSSLVPAVGATLDLSGDPVQQLIVSVTPTRPGVLAIPKHLVTWSVGWQSRTEQINEGLRIPAR